MVDLEKTEHRPYRTRTSVLFAADAPKAVILRRGPRTHYHLVSWDLETDTFEHGQWMKGNVQLCDLSPRGDKLLYFAEQYVKPLARSLQGQYEPLKQRPARKTPRAGRQDRKIPRYLRTWGSRGPQAPRELKDGWTAISTPPFFSALAIWPSVGRWTGGGAFAGESDLVLRETEDGLVPIENVAMPRAWSIRSWRQATGARTSAYAPSPNESERHVAIAGALSASGLAWVDWIDMRHGEDMLFAGDGRVCRLRRWRSVPEDELLSTAETLTDLRELSFRQLRPPSEAMHW
jgi:hypothetical protein